MTYCLQNNLKLHNGNWKTEADYKCNLCESYLHRGKIIEHITTVHCDSYFYKCQFCSNYNGCSKDALFQHQKDKHNIYNCFLVCPLCIRFTSPLEHEVVLHIEDTHFTKRGALITNKLNSQNQEEIKSNKSKNDPNYNCKIHGCRAKCQDPYQLFSHYVDKHFPSFILYYNCSSCELMFSSKHSLRQHRQDKHYIYDEENEETTVMIKCKICSFETETRGTFQNHLSKKHSLVFYNCPFKDCSYGSDLPWSMTQHATDKHLSNKVLYYCCPECDVSFIKSHSLMQHMRDRHFIEDTCPECYAQEEDLVDHLVSEHDYYDEYLSCALCNKEFEEKQDLGDHLKQQHSINILP